MSLSKFLIIYNTEYFFTTSAANVRDGIIKFAEFVGDNTYLFRTALNGCYSVKDIVAMFNHFSQHTINSIFEIEQTLYGEE